MTTVRAAGWGVGAYVTGQAGDGLEEYFIGWLIVPPSRRKIRQIMSPRPIAAFSSI